MCLLSTSICAEVVPRFFQTADLQITQGGMIDLLCAAILEYFITESSVKKFDVNKAVVYEEDQKPRDKERSITVLLPIRRI